MASVGGGSPPEPRRTAPQDYSRGMRITPSSLLLRVLAALVAVVVLAAACGSDSDPAATGDDDITQTDDESNADATGGEDSPEGDDSSDTDESDMNEDDGDMGDMLAGVAVFCESRADSDAAAEIINPTDPDSVRAWVYQTRDSIRDVLPQSPEEIRGDVATLLEAFDQFITILEAYDFDFFAALPEIEALQETPAQVAAEARLDAFEAANCPTESIDGEDASPNSFEQALATPEVFLAMLETEGGRDLILGGMTEGGDFTRDQAECLIDHPDFMEFFSLVGGETPSPDVIPTIMGVFAECGISLESLGG